MRALVSTFIAAAALCAAGCAATEPSNYDKATLSAITGTQQRLATLSTRIDANPLESEGDIGAYVRDMRSAAVEFDTLRGTLERLELDEDVRDELTAYRRQLGTTATLARQLATAVEDGDQQVAERTETAYVKAGSSLSLLAGALNDALGEAQ
jgi:hypothetical protein